MSSGDLTKRHRRRPTPTVWAILEVLAAVVVLASTASMVALAACGLGEVLR